jgi:hypothetical protein
MIRLLVTFLAMACVFTNVVIAADYVVRVDTIGYTDQPATEETPTEIVLRSLEVVTDSELRFHGKVTIGARTLQLRGQLKLSDTGDVFAQIRYEDLVDTGETVLTKDGKNEPIILGSQCNTMISGPLDKPITMGGMGITTTETLDDQSQATKSTITKLKYVLVVKKYEMPAD